MRTILAVAQGLTGAARMGGDPHLIDTEEEVQKARQIISDSLISLEKLPQKEKSEYCSIDMLRNALKMLDAGHVRLQVNPMHSEYEYYRCGGFVVGGRLLIMNSTSRLFELFTPLENQGYASFNIALFKGMAGQFNRAVLDRDEWEWIVKPLLDFQADANSCHLQDTFGANMQAALERDALSDAVARFEKIVGPKAGTARDIGGLAGNDVITNAQEAMMDFKGRLHVREADGQQDCTNEAWTTMGFIDAVMQHGLLIYHDMPKKNALVELESQVLRNLHVAVLLLDKSDSQPKEWVVDSWPRDNGEPPDIWPRAKWMRYWLKNLAGQTKD